VDSNSTNKRGTSLVSSLDLDITRDFFCLGCSSRPSTIYFSLLYTISILLVPIAQQAASRQPCWVAGQASLTDQWIKIIRKHFSLLHKKMFRS
jgi:hypothetical protein